jgi:putative transposase
MSRTARAVEGGMIYHVLNRGNGRMQIFRKPADFGAFIKILSQARQNVANIDVLGLCLMPNHWHLVLRPHRPVELAKFMRWVCTAHVRRHHAHYHSSPGHLYQGRYKSFPVQDDHHLLTLLRYVEANALRAGLCKSAGGWPWSSDAMRQSQEGALLLSDWPLDRPRNWGKLLEEKITEKELQRLRISVARGQPYGSEQWVERTARRLGLTFTLRPRGRPKSRESGGVNL